MTPNALVGYVRRNASGAVVSTTPSRAQDSIAGSCGCGAGGPMTYVTPGSTLIGLELMYRWPSIAVTTAAIVTAAARAASPT